MNIVIKSGRVIDPDSKTDGVLDVLIENGKVAKVDKDIKASADKIIDAQNKIVMPGIVDMHVHLREPGREDKETICSGTKAAVHGAVTSVLAMPNTEPAIDSPAAASLLKGLIKKGAKANVFICGAITIGRYGKEPVDIAGLKKEGVVAISDDGASVDSESVMQEALEQAKKEDILVICHCEDKQNSNNGQVNLGAISTRMGLRGVSRESEFKIVERDIKLAKKTGARIHIAHVSCKESVELIRQAKKSGVRVTCETAPHYFSLSEEAVLGFDTNFKMNPPLRTKEDRLAIKEGLSEDVIDVIASDHAPHTENEKEIEFERAAFGVIGLETELAVSIKELVDSGLMKWPELINKLSFNPARILGINKGTLRKGSDADIAVIAPCEEWVVAKESLLSKSKNSPFLGVSLKGIVEYTICSGKIVYKV